MPEPTKISAVEFAAKIKAKYPEYQDISDVELAQKMVAKYPEYVNVVELGEPQPVKKKRRWSTSFRIGSTTYTLSFYSERS
jgi:hypothetical protein